MTAQCIVFQAADTIERLEAENAALRIKPEQPDNKPLTLDELREISADMESRPWVWIKALIPFDCREKQSGYYRAQFDYTHGEEFVCGYPGISFSFAYADYGTTWIAYRRKPEQEGILMPHCHICSKLVTSGLVVCGECTKAKATNFDRITESPEALAVYMMCPYDLQEPDSSCAGKSCIRCSIDWLNQPIEQK